MTEVDTPARAKRWDVAQRLYEEHGPTYRLDLSYIGTPFHGFQSQITGQGVQDHLERALTTLLRHEVKVRGASRTDSGVHAQHQVALFRTHRPFDKRWLPGLNALTPKEIGIHRLELAAITFDPIFDALGKAYRYRLWQGKCWNPFFSPFVWAGLPDLDFDLLQEEAQALVGRHDFIAFCHKDSDAKTTVRRILEVAVAQHGPMIELWFVGEGFLKQMVRIMVGTLVAVARGQLPRGTVAQLLSGGASRSLAGVTAPAAGLCLVEIFFARIPAIASLRQQANHGFCWSLSSELSSPLS